MEAIAPGKCALVTGGERGIGRAVVERLLAEGYRVLVAGLDEEASESLLAVADTERLRFVRCDVGNETEVVEAVKAVREWSGRLDLLVANAGLASPYFPKVEDLELAHWEKILRTNLTGVFLSAKHSLPLLREARGSAILLASTRALMSEPHGEAYAASKGGIVALAHALAMSTGPEVRVNAISPGWIDCGDSCTPRAKHHAQHPAGRVGKPEDVADLVLYLAGAGFVTGQNFVIDGGMTKKMIYEE